jgi:hypothetical protein
VEVRGGEGWCDRQASIVDVRVSFRERGMRLALDDDGDDS